MVWQGRVPLASPWSDNKVEELRRLWAEGYSASDIARVLGDGLSRCGVLGKVNRLGLERRRKPQPAQAARRNRPAWPADPAAAGVPPIGVGGRHCAQEPFEKTSGEAGARCLVSIAARPLPRMRRLQLLQLQAHHCRWPFGTPGTHPFYFCAADKRRDDPYCPYHMDEALVKPRTR